ncbi:MAG TPA: ABC transporter permease [Caldilineaceae bacterium]|nr:ABC transporter permease [Caldilineaceae bacterium]
MNKVLLVAWREFRQHIRSRGFLIQALLLPVILIVVSLFRGCAGTQPPDDVSFPAQVQTSRQMIGVVDQAGILLPSPATPPQIQLQEFVDPPAANAALKAGDIDAYYLIPPDYRETGTVRWVGTDLPIAGPETDWFEQLLLTNVLATVDEAMRPQLRNPFNAAQVPIVEVGTAPPSSAIEREGELNWLPFLVTIVIMMPLFSSGGYLFQSLLQEKSNRVMEILLLALRPHQLLSGKLLGLGILTLVQYLIWLLIGLITLAFTDLDLTETWGTIPMNGTVFLLMVPFALGGYLLYAALMAGIGAVTPNIESNRAWVFVITLPMLIPLYLWTAIVSAPAGPLATALSLFPFSAPVAMIMRLSTATVAPWQIATSLVLLLLTGLGVIWLMARLFRAQTLLSGEALSVRRIWGALFASLLCIALLTGCTTPTVPSPNLALAPIEGDELDATQLAQMLKRYHWQFQLSAPANTHLHFKLSLHEPNQPPELLGSLTIQQGAPLQTVGRKSHPKSSCLWVGQKSVAFLLGKQAI